MINVTFRLLMFFLLLVKIVPGNNAAFFLQVVSSTIFFTLQFTKCLCVCDVIIKLKKNTLLYCLSVVARAFWLTT